MPRNYGVLTLINQLMDSAAAGVKKARGGDKVKLLKRQRDALLFARNTLKEMNTIAGKCSSPEKFI